MSHALWHHFWSSAGIMSVICPAMWKGTESPAEGDNFSLKIALKMLLKVLSPTAHGLALEISCTEKLLCTGKLEKPLHQCWDSGFSSKRWIVFLCWCQDLLPDPMSPCLSAVVHGLRSLALLVYGSFQGLFSIRHAMQALANKAKKQQRHSSMVSFD